MTLFMRGVLALLLAFSSASAFADQPKEWTFIFWENGRNSLDSQIARDVNEMEAVGSNAKMNLVVQHASMRDSNAQRYWLVKDANTTAITSPVVQQIPNADMGDPRQFADFVLWAMRTYPAKHYFVSIGSHGSGWYQRGQRSVNPNPMRAVSGDDKTGSEFTTGELGQALAYVAQQLGRRIDVFGTDACLMAMAELAAELHGSVDFFGASQQLEPGAGWNYTRFLSSMVRQQYMSPMNVAKLLVTSYTDQYARRQTFSAMDLSVLPTVAEGIKMMGAQMKKLSPDSRQKVNQLIASGKLSFFHYRAYVDMMDFAAGLASLNLPEFPASWLKSFADVTARMIIARQTQQAYPRAAGVSLWVPDSSTLRQYGSSYKKLRLQEYTQWAEALGSLYGMQVRRP